MEIGERSCQFLCQKTKEDAEEGKEEDDEEVRGVKKEEKQTAKQKKRQGKDRKGSKRFLISNKRDSQDTEEEDVAEEGNSRAEWQFGRKDSHLCSIVNRQTPFDSR